MIQIETKKGMVSMSSEEFARWMCFSEAFHFIEKKASELDVDWENMIKPLAIEKYISERFPAMHHDIITEYKESF